jgi:predicted phage baseplate assembly protein
MPLPVPDLDDRRFQDLVDDAKRLVMRRCPEWTDHNVSDPGVTLIETFAFMTDQLLYRLNRVPDRLYIRFLELIGLRLLPPAPARVPVTFWLSTPATAPLVISAGTQAATVRTEHTDSVVFATREHLAIVPCTLQRVRSTARGPEEAGTAGEPGTADRTRLLRAGTHFPAFGTPPQAGDALLLGLSDPVPGCAVRLDFRGHAEGVGVNPGQPPLVWEAWAGEGWAGCETGTDPTGGLNRSGAITVHVPGGHTASVIGGERAGWLRARVTDPAEGQPPYSASPVIEALTACTVGGTCGAIHAEIVSGELLGESEGVPGQQFALARRPVLAGAAAPVVETSSGDGWQEWTQVEHFAESSAGDRHFVLDAVSGLVLFGPAVRGPDGGLRYHGAVPGKGAQVRISEYATGGGTAGNVRERAIQTLKSSIPFVAAVENRHPANGGADGETLDEAKARGPLLLRTRSRAVTAEDYEVLTREAAPEAARVRCIAAGQHGAGAAGVRVLVVPAAAAGDGRIVFESLVPPKAMLAAIATRLEEVRVAGTRVVVEPPLYRGVTVVARLVARPRVKLDRITADAERALYSYLSPLPGGGPGGEGWPFGRPVTAGEVYGLLQRVRGVELVEDVRLFTANPVTGERGGEAPRIGLEPGSLVFSYDHQVRVETH